HAALAPHVHQRQPGRFAFPGRRRLVCLPQERPLSPAITPLPRAVGHATGNRQRVLGVSYSLATLWFERQRYLPGVLAVGFSALLIALQCGLLLGIFSITSIPVDHTRAHIWLCAPEVLSVDLGRPIPESYLVRLASQPEVESPELFLQGFAYWGKPNGG